VKDQGIPVATAHPLDPLSAREIETAVAAVRGARDPQGQLRFVSITLDEPTKDVVAQYAPGTPIVRRAELVILDPAARVGVEAIVDLGTGEIEQWRLLEGLQPAIIPEEYHELERAVKAHPDFLAALARRGVTELDLVAVDPIPSGTWDDHAHTDRRLCRALTWMRPDVGGNQYARPIEGIVGLVDLNTSEVLEIVDNGAVAIPIERGEYRAGRVGPERDDLKPIEITQPDGPSFTVTGNLVRWQRWSLRIGFTPREGLVLHTIGYEDGGRVRPILHRASFSEMAVPYGDPSPNRYIQAPFDIGENLIGTLANSLELGCDCLGEIFYFDAVVSNSRGEAVRIPNGICMHEEDYGVLWKHTDMGTQATEVRRSRRLVVSSFSTIGNYEYGFFWYLYQDGTIESEVKATGIIATSAVPPGTTPRHGQLVAEGLNGMIHQHFFNARLDFDIDGRGNSVYEVHTESEPIGETNPYGNAFFAKRTLLGRESETPALIDPLRGRYWMVVNPDVHNAVGESPGYKLMPGENVQCFARPDSPYMRRAGFLSKHLWVTRFDARERYAAGDYPNQHPVGDGLPAYVAQDRSLENEDLVVWYTFGLHHLPRPEDWPVMPVAYLGFMLKPVGFFDRNPALDVPPSRAHATADCHHGHQHA
jgi:primary-amine oxidase